MSNSFQIGDADFTNVIASLSLPTRNGLVAEYTFGVSQALSVVNRAAPGLASMTLVGTPTYGTNFAEIRSGVANGSVGFDTGITPPEDATMIVVVRNTTSCPSWMSDGAATYFGFHNYLSAPLLYNSQTGTASNTANVSNPAHTNFAFYAGQLPKGGRGVIFTYTDGVETVNTAETNGGATRSTTSIKLGTTLNNGGIGIARMAYAAMFSRVLTALEIRAAYASLKAFMATRGVVVS